MVALPDTWGVLNQQGHGLYWAVGPVYVEEEGQCFSVSGGKENQLGHHLGSVSLTSPVALSKP